MDADFEILNTSINELLIDTANQEEQISTLEYQITIKNLIPALFLVPTPVTFPLMQFSNGELIQACLPLSAHPELDTHYVCIIIAPQYIIDSLRTQLSQTKQGFYIGSYPQIVHVTDVPSLRNAVNQTKTTYAQIDTGGYYKLDTKLLIVNGNVCLDGSHANSPVMFRCSSISTQGVVTVGVFNNWTPQVALRHISLMGGRGSGTPSKRPNLQIYNAQVWLDHVIAILSSTEACVILNTDIGKNQISRNLPNLIAHYSIFGLALYESTNPADSEGRHPMNFNVQEGGIVYLFNCAFVDSDQRNPLVQEGAICVMVNCINFGARLQPYINSQNSNLMSVLELIACMSRDNNTTSNSTLPNVTNSNIYPVQVYVDYARQDRSGHSIDNQVQSNVGNIEYLIIPSIQTSLSKQDVFNSILNKIGSQLPAKPSALNILINQMSSIPAIGNSRTPSISSFFTGFPFIYTDSDLDSEGYPL